MYIEGNGTGAEAVVFVRNCRLRDGILATAYIRILRCVISSQYGVGLISSPVAILQRVINHRDHFLFRVLEFM